MILSRPRPETVSPLHPSVGNQDSINPRTLQPSPPHLWTSSGERRAGQGACAVSSRPSARSALAICWKLGKAGDVLNRLDARGDMREYPRIPVSGGPQSVQ